MRCYMLNTSSVSGKKEINFCCFHCIPFSWSVLFCISFSDQYFLNPLSSTNSLLKTLSESLGFPWYYPQFFVHYLNKDSIIPALIYKAYGNLQLSLATYHSLPHLFFPTTAHLIMLILLPRIILYTFSL